MRARLAALTLFVSLHGVGCAKPVVDSVPPASPTSPATHGIDASRGWTQLVKQLPGTWVATIEGGTVEVNYRVVAHGSALLETFGVGTAGQSLTVYHPDGRGLMLTHYCSQGNQVRLRASAASEDRITFVYVDATNVDPAQSVMHEQVFVFGPDTLERTEVYRAHDGALSTGVLRFVRQ